MMDPNADAEAVPSQDNGSEGAEASIARKRTFEGSDDGGPMKKKARGEPSLVECTRRVAELALVLSAMMEMRGGRSPTAAEMNMMAEARGKVVELCGELAPIDIVPRDAVGFVMEDLGLNKFRDQREGFRPPQISIAEKLSFTQRKMEESKAAAANAASYSSQRPNTGPLNTVRIFTPDKPNHPSVQSGGVQVPAGTSTPLSSSYPSNGIRQSTVSSGLSKSQVYKDSTPVLPKAERLPFRLDGGLNGTSYASQVGANSNDHPPVKAAMWSLQPQSPLTRTGPQNKVLVYPSVKVESTTDTSMSKVNPQSSKDQSSKTFTTQATSGNLPPQVPLIYNGHHEISKLVQNLLQPQLSQIPTWTPPSREYMSKTLTCQACKVTINEVETALVCDACEKGFHLKCILSDNQNVIPVGEWHCSRCLVISNGKPLPPKYGRVMRNMNVPKMSVNNPLEKKMANSQDQKTNKQRVGVNVNFCERETFHFTENIVSTESESEKLGNVEETHGNQIIENKQEIDKKPSFESCVNTSMNSPVADLPPTGSTDGKPPESIHACEPSSSELILDRDLKTMSSRKDDSDDINDLIQENLDGSDVGEANHCGKDVVQGSPVTVTGIVCDSREQDSFSADCGKDAVQEIPVPITQIGSDSREQVTFLVDGSDCGLESDARLKSPAMVTQIGSDKTEQVIFSADGSDCDEDPVPEKPVLSTTIGSDSRDQVTFIADECDCAQDVIQETHVTVTQIGSDSREQVSFSVDCGQDPVPITQIDSDSKEQVTLVADGSECGLESDALQGNPAMDTQIASDKKEQVIFSADGSVCGEDPVPENPVLSTQIGSESRDQVTFIADGSDCGEDLVQENQVKISQIGSHNNGENVNFSEDESNCCQDVVPEIPLKITQIGCDSEECSRFSAAEYDCGQDVVQGSPVKITQIHSECGEDAAPESGVKTTQIGCSDSVEQVTFSVDVLHNVSWVGDIDRVLDEKAFYHCCCINGIMYKVQDYGLFCYGNGRLIPSKLQEMWEDSESWSKWISIRQCYFPDNLPEVVRKPCPPESNEVYESNHVNTVMAGLIHGPCLVLPPEEYVQESERRTHLGIEGPVDSQPVFQCRWVYDEYTGLFQPIHSS